MTCRDITPRVTLRPCCNRQLLFMEQKFQSDIGQDRVMGHTTKLILWRLTKVVFSCINESTLERRHKQDGTPVQRGRRKTRRPYIPVPVSKGSNHKISHEWGYSPSTPTVRTTTKKSFQPIHGALSNIKMFHLPLSLNNPHQEKRNHSPNLPSPFLTLAPYQP